MSGSSSGRSASVTVVITARTLAALGSRAVSAATEKMRAGGAAGDRDRHVRALRGAPAQRRAGAAPRGGARAAHRGSERRGAARAPMPPTSSRVVVLKLNGGLGTSMGMTRAKSLLEVKDGHTLPRRDRAPGAPPARAEHGAAIPLLLMNSFATRDDTLEALEQLPGAAQSTGCRSISCRARCPKLLADGYEPVSWEADPALEWAPPGPRRRVHLARHVGHPVDAARARLRVPVPVELGQPRRGARATDPRLVRERRAAVRLRGGGPDRGRP